MPLFRVQRRLNHDLVAYEPNTIHEFKCSDAIQHLVDIGVLIQIDPSKSTFCPTCKARAIGVDEGETHYYKSDESNVIMKQETCARCGRMLNAKARPDELKKIKEGSLKVEKRIKKKKRITYYIFEPL